MPAEHTETATSSITFAHLQESGESAPTQGLRTLFGSQPWGPHVTPWVPQFTLTEATAASTFLEINTGTDHQADHPRFHLGTLGSSGTHQ